MLESKSESRSAEKSRTMIWRSRSIQLYVIEEYIAFTTTSSPIRAAYYLYTIFDNAQLLL